MAGITLLELLIALAAALIVTAWGIPNLRQITLNAHRSAALNHFITAVHLTRSEAIKRAQDAVLCGSHDGLNCALDGNGWPQFWLVFVNLDEDDPAQVDPDEPLLRIHQPAVTPQLSANRRAFVMRPFDRRATNGTVTFCDERGSVHARAIIISYTGRPRVSASKPDGSPLECD